MKQIFSVLIFLFVIPCAAKVRVATTTPDLASIVREVGQDQVDVFAVAKGTQDPHLIEAKPSFMVKLRDVDLLMAQGLELESAWMTPLIQGSRNEKLMAKSGVLEIGPSIDPIEVQSKSVSRADGDVHPEGNPHFQLDPVRLGQAAILIAKRLGEIDPNHKDFYLAKAEAFQSRMNEKLKDWQARVKKSGVTELVTYHKTFAYLCLRFQMKCELQIEPKPGIPPTAQHLIFVIDQMKKRQVNLVLIENVYEDTVAQKIHQDLPKVHVVRVPVSVGGEPEILNNEALIERLVRVIEGASQKGKL